MISEPTKIRKLREKTKYENKSKFKNIPVTRRELKTLRMLKDQELIKIMFVILLISKCNRYGNTPCDDFQIARIAKVRKWKKDIGEMLQPYVSEDEVTEGYLLQFRFIKYKGKYRPYYHVLFSQGGKLRNGKYGKVARPFIVINDLDTCIEELLEKTDMFETICYNCGKRFFNVNKKKLYCNSCQKKMKKIRDRQYIRTRRYNELMLRNRDKAKITEEDTEEDTEEKDESQ